MFTKLTSKFVMALLTLFFAPQGVFAINPLKNPLEEKTLLAWINKIPDILLLIAGPIFLVVLLIGGIQLMTSGGNPEASSKAKITLIWGVIGLVVIAVGKSLMYFFVAQV